MNWGYKLVAVFVVFAGMMGFMVYRCFNTNTDLVEKEYYKSELRYQEVIDGRDNANKLSAAPQLTQSGSDIILQMPEEMKNASVSGAVLFYCAYDATKDRKLPLAIDKNGVQSFSSKVKPGRYIVKIDWNKDGRNYYAEKNITIL
jgi:nitrogen fixation protein FixH